MSISLNCTIKGCGKFMEPTLDVKSNKVYCSECNGEQTASHFTKQSLKATGQTKKAIKSAYSVKCVNCKWEALPTLLTGCLCCPQCSKQHKNIAKPFENLIREAIKQAAHNDNNND